MTTVIRAELAADGTRTIEITWDDGADPSLTDVLRVLDELGPEMPSVAMLARAAQPSDPADTCRRSLCGHPHAYHRNVDDQGMTTAADPEHGGMCEACDNPDSCRSFVGRYA